jgi:hypothetical protein
MEPPQCEERRKEKEEGKRGGRKRKRRGRKRKRGATLFCVRVMPIDMTRLMHESHRLTWRDRVDVSQRPPAWRVGHAPAP